MEVSIKHFSELSRDELFDIYKLRVSVFVVEQQCPYQEVDDGDRSAYHVFMKDEEGIQAYLRILPAGVSFDQVSLGRVIAVKRRRGLGTRIVLEASKRPENCWTPGKSKSKRRSMPRSCMRRSASFGPQKNFWRTGFPTWKWCGESRNSRESRENG